MTKEHNIMLAKKHIKGTIYNSVVQEGLNLTFPQTETIYDFGVPHGVDTFDINIVLNLRNTWHYILNNIDKPLTVDYIKRIHDLVSRGEALVSGEFRSTGKKVTISGVDYIPVTLEEDEIERRINEVLLIEDPLERALEYYALGTKSQFFWDGNKRTSAFIVNKILIENGLGLFTVDKNSLLTFNEKLSDYYEDNTKKNDLLLYIVNNLILSGDIQQLIYSGYNQLTFEIQNEQDVY